MSSEQIEHRRHWMACLAKARPGEVEAAWQRLDQPAAYQRLRGPETGLVMVRGRAGGTGGAFNLGEMTVTRCSVRLADGRVGHAYVAGRNARHAELAAALDAVLQGCGPVLRDMLVEPLAQAQASRRQAAAAKVAATRVDFFTMVRGED